MEFTAENMEKAVLLFYRAEAVQQAEAHQWLTEAQSSPHAWSFVWELLHPHRTAEVQFFAATTLHIKLMKNWEEVPVDHYEVLKKKILEAIISYASGPKIVLNRLCITLSAYIIHTVPNHWPNAFEELVSSFQPQHLPNVEPERVIWILLEILTVIPEEFQSTILVSSQRNRVRNVLLQVSKDILKVVEMCLTPLPTSGYDMSNLTTYLNAARCASTWIQLGGVNIDECSHLMTIFIDLTCFIYWNKEDPEGLNSEELEATEVAIEALTSVVNHPSTYKFKNYILKLTESILHNFMKILRAENSNSEPNKDVLTTFYTLIVTIADSHSKIFIELLSKKNKQEQQLAVDLLTCMLECANTNGCYPIEETSSSICFGFWYTLQDDILSLETGECAELLLTVKPFYRELVCVMARKSMYPDSSKASNWSLDDKEVFRCYRQDVADTYMYCYNVLNIEMLDILNTKLNEALAECILNIDRWNHVESCLHGFSSVAECIEMENLYLPKLMFSLKNIPYNDLNYKVLSSALDCIASYSEWITDHPDLLANVIPLVISGIGNSDVAPSATMALKDLSHNCQRLLLPYADHILQACQLALQSGVLKLAEHIRIMYSLGKILGILPVPRIMEYLNVILSPSFEEIQTLVNAEPDATVTNSLITRLKIVSALFGTLLVQNSPANGSSGALGGSLGFDENAGLGVGSLAGNYRSPGSVGLERSRDVGGIRSGSCQQPLFIVMQNTMPLYKMIGSKYCRNTEMFDVLCGLLKHAVTTLMDDCKPIINDILEIIVSAYREAPQASILILTKTIIIMFGRDKEFVRIMQQLVYEIVNTSLRMSVEMNAQNQLSEKNDVIEAFFTMMAQMYKKVPVLLQTSNLDMATVFQCAIMCLAMPEMHTMKVCTSFIINFITQSRDNNQANIVQTYGESLVMRVIISISGQSPRACVDVLSDIFLVLNKKYCDNLSRWLHNILQQEGFPSPKVSTKQKENFIRLVLKEKVNKRKLAESVIEFALLCRGILSVDPATLM